MTTSESASLERTSSQQLGSSLYRALIEQAATPSDHVACLECHCQQQHSKHINILSHADITTLTGSNGHEQQHIASSPLQWKQFTTLMHAQL
jgi:hypothetical protein